MVVTEWLVKWLSFVAKTQYCYAMCEQNVGLLFRGKVRQLCDQFSLLWNIISLIIFAALNDS